jgi:exopolyphosphatase/guanosine-5'-triphosphate,3'-diphosphate pyrophosphatase
LLFKYKTFVEFFIKQKKYMRIAVIDLGTNTFNILIAEQENGDINSLYNEKISVKLGRGGIGSNIIKPDAFNRGLTALNAHKQAIANYKAEKIIALGTSALRTAENSAEFLKSVKEQLGFDIDIITGDREAELIYKGVRQTLDDVSGNILILDIGGGSNEFILANNKEIIWKQSFNVGMARLLEQFSISDPILPEEIIILEKHFEKELQPLFKMVKKTPIDYFVGAEGTFEAFHNIINYIQNPDFHPQKSNKAKKLSHEDFHRLHECLIRSTSLQRMKMKGLEPYRVEMVVPATIFVDYVLKHINTKQLVVSPHSMKEGAAWEVFKG